MCNYGKQVRPRGRERGQGIQSVMHSVIQQTSQHLPGATTVLETSTHSY